MRAEAFEIHHTFFLILYKITSLLCCASRSPLKPSYVQQYVHIHQICKKNKIHLHHVVRAEAHEPLPLGIHPRMSREHRTVLVDGLPEAGLPERVQALRVQPVGQSFRG